MASIKVKYRSSTLEGKEGTLYFQIIHERRVRQLSTAYKIQPHEWRENMALRAGSEERRPVIMAMREGLRRDFERLRRIVNRLEESGGTYSVDDVIDEYRQYVNDYTLFRFMERIISRLQENGRHRTAETYAAALNSFRKFRAGRDIMLDCISSDVMQAYQAWQRSHSLVPNTISFYARILRATYNRAVDEGIIDNHSPFRHIYTGICRTRKRALPLSMITKLRRLNLSHHPAMDFARDMFMLSFMLRGMSFVDMAYLRKRDLADGYVTYRRRKTGQSLMIAWTKEMQSILDKYAGGANPYLLPIIRRSGINERYAYRNAGYRINHNLKKIGRLLGLDISLTMYVARHSWASAAKAKGIPLSVISEGMGHNNEATTRIYLASLDTSVVDRANSVILRSI